MTLDVNASNCDHEINSGNNVGGMLNCLIQINHEPSSSEIVFKVIFEFSHVIENSHIQNVIVSGREQ